MNDITDKLYKEEFDVDTGTYMEDVHSNDFVGLDKDGDGLVDNVEELIEESYERAEAYNAEQERIKQERIEKEFEEEETEDEKDEKTDYGFNLGL